MGKINTKIIIEIAIPDSKIESFDIMKFRKAIEHLLIDGGVEYSIDSED